MSFRLDRSVISIARLDAEFRADNDFAYWQTQVPETRLRAVELMRQTLYGYAPDTVRLQRIFEVAERAPR